MRFIIYTALLFAFSELLLMIVKQSRIKNVKTRNDKGSMVLLWIMITSGITGGFFMAKYDAWTIINYLVAGVGLILVFTGLTVRWSAIIQLGRFFTVDVSVSDTRRT